MGTSIAGAIDYLVTSLTNGVTVAWRGVAVPPLSAINPQVEVVDVTPTANDNVWVVIGRTDWDQDESATGQAEYASLGAQEISEDYTIPGFVHVIVDGSVQKPARDAAVALFDGVVKLLNTDPTFGGLLRKGRIGLVSNLSLTQADQSGSTEAVSAVLHFEIQVHNVYIP